ncbi:MAG: hypothetical protein R6X02_32185 [Enhygromyxa sp.]
MVKPHYEEEQVMIKMPTAVVEADVCAKPTTDAAASELAHWTVGISRTLFEDYRFALYEKGYLFDRFSDSSGPALDVAPTDAPFDTGSGDAPGSIHAAKLRDNPTRLEAADTAPTAAPMANPDVHKDCTPPDRLRAHIRLMDFSAYLLARHNLTNEVHTLAQAQYHQISEVRFAPRLAGFALKFDKVALGLPDVDEKVLRPPALGSTLGNQLVEPLRFVEKDEC